MENHHDDQEYIHHQEHPGHHHHGEECGCGHEHHDHEHAHHHHGEECSCGHQHHDHHDHEHHHHDSNAPYIVDGHTHEGASVGTGALTVNGIYTDFEEAVKTALKGLADWVTAQGGIIGHIKSSLVSTHTAMLSITEEDVNVIKPQEEEIRINLAAIVFAIPLDDLEKQVEEICKKLLLMNQAKEEKNADAFTKGNP